jgi:hypothetical protein
MRTSLASVTAVSAILLLSLGTLLGQQGNTKSELTGRYEGTAKSAAGEVISVTLALTEEDGAVSGTISSSRGDFQITGGSQQGKTVTLHFDAEGTSGTISLEASEDKLVGTWSAGDDGGPVDVKKVAAQPGDAKEKTQP